MLQSLHILLEVRHAGLRLQHRGMQRGRGLFQIVIELLVVHQRSHGSLSGIDLGAHRIQMRRGQSCVVNGLLAAVQNTARLLEHVRHHQRRFALDDLAVLHIGLPGGSKRNRHVLIAQHSFGLDRGDGILLDNLVR